MILKRCRGCGSILQSNDINAPGYIPDDISPDKELFCKRCFRMKHYNELPKIIASNKDYEFVIDRVLKKKALIVLIVDLFDFEGTFIPKIIEKLRNKDVIIVANKFDILPKSTNVSKIVDWISTRCNKIFFRVNAINVVSSKKGYYIDDLMNTIDLLRNERDVYFVGCANVGKSSIINALLKRFTPKTDNLISTSVIPGTTLDEIAIPFFEDNKSFIDTPGLINDGSVINHLSAVSYKKIIPDCEIKPITYQLEGGNGICIGGLAAIEIINKKASAICYFANTIITHRTKIDKIDGLFSKQLGILLTPPTINELENIEYCFINYCLDGKIKRDIVFSGLGFISIVGECELRVRYIKGTDVMVRGSINEGNRSIKVSKK